MKTPLRELSESISLRISSLDEELKVKTGELQVLRASLQAIERKTQGNALLAQGHFDAALQLLSLVRRPRTLYPNVITSSRGAGR